MEECAKDNLRDAIGELQAYKAKMGKANDAMNEAIGAINRLESENQKLKEGLQRLKDAKPEEPQCLDADGVPIEVGDKVCFWHSRTPGEVLSIEYTPGKTPMLELSNVAGLVPCDDCRRPKPDSWEQLMSDVAYTPYAYALQVRDCTEPEADSYTIGDQKLDLIRRAKRLTGVDDD